MGLAGGDAGVVDGEPLGAGLLGSGVPPDGLGAGVVGAEVGLPDGLGVAVGGGDEGVPVGPGVGRTVGVAVGGLVVGRVAVGLGAPVAGRAVVGSALGRGSDSVWATGTVGGAMSAGDGPETTSAPGVAGRPGVGVAGAGRRSGVPAARAGRAPPESLSASPSTAKPTPAPPSSRAARAPVTTGSAAERGWRGRRWAGNERS
ncbi:hypothetical protein ACFOOK_00595 [Micromonospora krabiensis]|uniref:hypothetical protein n=1 Tax=Micromonospora krabiensis TaxID=307121 RepID=UPI000B1AEAB7|nr:hypothetical protein [Micromonospora krabiensis]